MSQNQLDQDVPVDIPVEPALNAQAASSRIQPLPFTPIDPIALQEEANLSRLLAKIVIETPLAQSISTLSTLALIASNILSDPSDASKRKVRLKAARIDRDICSVKLADQVLLDSGWRYVFLLIL
jgi:hypothetical protein